MARAIDVVQVKAEIAAEKLAVIIENVSVLLKDMQSGEAVKIATLTTPNEPLTLEELREMDGEPVYMTFPSDTGNQCGHWALVGTQRWGAVSLIYGCGWSSYESAVETLGAKFYRRPPEGEEHCYG